MQVIFDHISYILGGMMISSAMSLSRRSSQKGAEPTSSLSNFLSIDLDSKWKSSFVAGMIFAASLVSLLYGFNEVEHIHLKPFEKEKLFFKGTGLLQFIFSGFLTGFGLKLARGNLSSYAFSGVPKFNSQSLTTTGIALLFAAITATLRNTFPILQGINITKKFNEHLDFRLSLVVPLIMIAYNLSRNYRDTGAIKEILKSFGIGNLLASGMMAAGYTKRHQMLDFLSLSAHWSPFLIFVLIGAFLGSYLMSYFFGTQPLPNISASPPEQMTSKDFIGSSLFGLGLGISGLIPGAGLLVSAIYLPQIVLFFLPFIAIGQVTAGFAEKFMTRSPKIIKTT